MKKIYKKKSTKIGVLGGTFDPPHKGHYYISKIGIKKLKLEKLIWLITKKNPLKDKPFLSIKKRIQLSKKITSSNRKISVQYIDSKIRSSNTFDFLKYIKKKNPNTELYFLMGSDNLTKFHTWFNWRRIPKIARIVVFPRGKYLKKTIVTEKLNKKDFMYINYKKINISSSLIRKF